MDSLVEAGQKYWQVLPVGPTSFGDSPYQSFSAFAGNPYFIDFDLLIKESLLEKSDVIAHNWGENDNEIDYATIYKYRFQVLMIAYKNSFHRKTTEYKSFVRKIHFG